MCTLSLCSMVSEMSSVCVDFSLRYFFRLCVFCFFLSTLSFRSVAIMPNNSDSSALDLSNMRLISAVLCAYYKYLLITIWFFISLCGSMHLDSSFCWHDFSFGQSARHKHEEHNPLWVASQGVPSIAWIIYIYVSSDYVERSNLVDENHGQWR